MLPSPADRAKLGPVLDQLTASVEELLLSGLTTASEATRQALSVAMQEAARFRLLRLGSTLRALGEELSRFTRQDPLFSRRRLTYFLNRSWLLSRGLAHALRTADEKEYDRLAWTPQAEPVPKLEVVCMGAVKKVAAGSFVAFEFRLRATAGSGPVQAGDRLAWSAIFPIKPGVNVPPEGFLHLPQKQKFNASVFLDRATIQIENATLARDASHTGRIGLTDTSRVSVGKPFSEWRPFLSWSPTDASERVRGHVAGPLDVETELQEEVVLTEYELGPQEEGDEPNQTFYPIASGPLRLHALVGPAAESKALAANLESLRKSKGVRPPLYGLLHYERCRLLFQPLTTFTEPGPDYLTISRENIDKAALLKAMSFT
jgi:hypothetical protein